MRVVVYSTGACPKCAELKHALDAQGVKFEAVDMSTSEAITELRISGLFTLTAQYCRWMTSSTSLRTYSTATQSEVYEHFYDYIWR